MKKVISHIALVLIATVATGLVAYGQGYTETVLHNFPPNALGWAPANLVRDAAGNFYGTAGLGGTSTACSGGCGVVYKLFLDTRGVWEESIVHDFTGGADGAVPNNILMDSSGNIYGSTAVGGSTGCRHGCGVVFKLTPLPSGGWYETVLYSFTSSATGRVPYVTLMDSQHNLYGAVDDGQHGQGEIFRLAPSSSGSWTFTNLYAFTGGADGSFAAAAFLDSAGNIYGYARSGGNTACLGGCGLIFKLSAAASAPWTETVLYTFSGTTDGFFPTSLIQDAAGNLFGATNQGGTGTNANCPANCGTIFELSPASGGGYTKSVLINFNYTLNGAQPFGWLGMDAAGHLYATAGFGGSGKAGVVLKLTPPATSGGLWTYTFAHSFSGKLGGGLPTFLLTDPSGTLYGVTNQGGTKGEGTVYVLTP